MSNNAVSAVQTSTQTDSDERYTAPIVAFQWFCRYLQMFWLTYLLGNLL